MSPGTGKVTPGLRTIALRIGLLPLFLPTQYITEMGTILSLCRSMLHWRSLTSADSKQNLLQRTDLVKVICRLSLTLLAAQCSCFFWGQVLLPEQSHSPGFLTRAHLSFLLRSPLPSLHLCMRHCDALIGLLFSFFPSRHTLDLSLVPQDVSVLTPTRAERASHILPAWSPCLFLTDPLPNPTLQGQLS